MLMKLGPYDHKKIEKKWQKAWDKSQIYQAESNSKKPKFYGLIEFPFPSGSGMHIGHLRSNTGMDIIARKRRMEGYNVLFPIGWDAFGLPTENYAIKTGKQPKVVTKENTDNFRKQLKSAGFSFDWSREINTTDPEYYRWTQWIFLQMYKKGLAYKKRMIVNWCPKDKIVLSNEEVIDGTCERCGTPVEKREKEQWMLAITKYAERLDKDLDTVDYLEKIKTQQRNWIGRSEGAEIVFKIKNSALEIKVFTTRADTLYGVTYVVLAPEHELIFALQSDIKNWTEVEKYIVDAKKKNEIERTAAEKTKTGVELKGVKVLHPVTHEEIPVYSAEYVLAHYGTGAVMAVPAHDERDFTFATKYNLPIKEVIIPRLVDMKDPPVEGKKTVERKAVQVILIDPKTKKVLMLKWKKFPWTTFITGGVEGDEDIIEAARREILEETGYKNTKFIRHLGGKIESHFYANHKGENRKALFSGMIFELENEARNEMSEEEKAIHEICWMTWAELEKDKNVKCSEYNIYLDRFFNLPHAFTELGVLQDSSEFNGMRSEQARKEIAKKYGKLVTTYKLRDWIFSRQRYWGEPIPMINCPTCRYVPVPEKDLPVKLPEVKNYVPTDTGESPLAAITKWVNVKCPVCGGKAKRETDTMPNWAGSSWYYLRYTDPENKKAFADKKKLEYWTPVDWYNGGMEHTTLHLLYSRFWHKFLFDIGVVPTNEPYKKRTSQGLILAADGAKISKSKGNGIEPDAIIETNGADALRLYEMFMGPFEQAVSWSDDGVVGPRRFLERVWKLQERIVPKFPFDADLESLIHQTIKKVSEDIEAMRFNTAVSSLMILLNAFEKKEKIAKSYAEHFFQLVAPFAPHITEEFWKNLGYTTSIHTTSWPSFNASKLQKEELTIVVQVNGKMRGEFKAPVEITQDMALNIAKSLPEVMKWLEGKEVKKEIYVKGRLVNIVV
jgi:leucyl-tRNA synthetase